MVVGGGPAGLACAVALRGAGVGDVVVLEREADAGGIPRHADHTGFGLRDLRRVLRGPAYARALAEAAARAGADVRTSAMVTGVAAGGELEVTSPRGRELLEARAVVLATGCRERPRAARLVPGTRPAGVLTTGELQQLVTLRGERAVGRRAVVVGAEHVSFSALLTLSHGGAQPVGMATRHPRHQSFAAVRAGAAARWRLPLWTSTEVSAIAGRRRVEAVELTDVRTGRVRRVACDTVVFSADWIPDHELAVMAGVELGAVSRGPVVDARGRTSRRGWFAAGNVVHPAEAADVCALAGRELAGAVAAFLRDGAWPRASVEVLAGPPLAFAAPGRLVAGEAPAAARVVLRAAEVARAAIEVRQGDRLLLRTRRRTLVPGRAVHLAVGWTATVAAAGPVRVELAGLSPRRTRARPSSGAPSP